MQVGKHVARLIDQRVQADTSAPPRGTAADAFAYHDKGSMATIGRKRGIAKIGKLGLSGVIAWPARLFVHLLS